MADDLGYGDVGCYGQQKINTPNIDRMASQGMLFTQAYSGHSVCAPSRSALMTGLHTGKTPIRGNRSVFGERVSLPDSVMTIAELLKQKGYVNGIFGKWGLGDLESEGFPIKKGFDEFVGFLDQGRAHSYCVDYLWQNNEKVFFPENEDGSCKTHAAEYYFEKLKNFIKNNKENPFFVYYATQLPHAELKSTAADLQPYLNPKGKSIFREKAFDGGGNFNPTEMPFATYAAMVSQLDRHVGEVCALIDDLNLSKNTIIFFTSDNGPHSAGGYDPEFFNSSGILRGSKGDLYEGGIRVPLIVKWEGEIVPGSVTDYPWASWDLMATAAELVGEEVPLGIDGVSALEVLKGKTMHRKNILYWEYLVRNELRIAIVDGKWKGLTYSLSDDLELYNLDIDPSETTDLADRYPEKIAGLKELIRINRVKSGDWPIDNEKWQQFLMR